MRINTCSEICICIHFITDDNQKIEDEIMNDMLNQGTTGGTEGDEKVTDDQNGKMEPSVDKNGIACLIEHLGRI